MKREDFFNELEECLKGEVTEAEYMDAVAYYRDYFRDQMAAGRSEEDISQELGSPRLIARSIIEANEAAQNTGGFGGYYDADNGSYEVEGQQKESGQGSDLLKKIGGVAAVILVFMLIGALLHMLLPVIGIIVLVILISRLFRRS